MPAKQKQQIVSTAIDWVNNALKRPDFQIPMQKSEPSNENTPTKGPLPTKKIGLPTKSVRWESEDEYAYDYKIAEARSTIAQHTKAVAANAHMTLDTAIVAIFDIGGTSNQRLKLCQVEDLTNKGFPPLLARQLTEIFRKDPPRNIGTGRSVNS